MICPGCNTPVKAFMSFHGDATPEEGKVSICGDCLRFTRVKGGELVLVPFEQERELLMAFPLQDRFRFLAMYWAKHRGAQ